MATKRIKDLASGTPLADTDKLPIDRVAGTRSVTWKNIKDTLFAIYELTFAPLTRTVSAGTGLTGGGSLAADRTLSADISASTPAAVGTAGSAGSSGKLVHSDHVHAITAATIISAMGAAATALAMNAQKITGLAVGSSATDAPNLGQVLQPVANTQSGGYALAAADIGAVVFATGAGAQAFTLPTLAGSLIAGRVLLLTIQQTGAATNVTITPGGTSQIDGAGTGVAFVVGAGRKRVSLFSLDGLNWYSGA